MTRVNSTAKSGSYLGNIDYIPPAKKKEETLMRLKIQWQIISGLTLLLAVMLCASCGGDKPKGSKISSEVTELVRYYQEMKNLGLAGNVQEFLDRRDSVTKAEIAAYFKWKGWTIDSAKVSNWTFNWPDVAGLPLEQDTSDGQWRRLVFRMESQRDQKTGKEIIAFPIIMFRKESGQWKVSNASRFVGFKLNNDGTPQTLSQFQFHEMFRIPPTFEGLKEKPDSAKTAVPFDSIFKPIPRGTQQPNRR
jgi:hypothetical protein